MLKTILADPVKDTDIPEQETGEYHSVDDLEKAVDDTQKATETTALEMYTLFNALSSEKSLKAYLTTSTLMSLESVHTLSYEEISAAAEEKAAEHAEGWGEKALSVLKETTAAIVNKVGAGIDKIWGVAKALSSSAWDSTEGLRKTIKAHPYQTVAVAIAAAVGIGTIVALCSGSLPVIFSGGAGALPGVFAKISSAIGSIKWPFGSFSTVVSKRKIAIKYVKFAKGMSKFKETPVGTIQELGWTKSAVTSVMTGLNKIKTLAPNMSKIVYRNYLKEYVSTRRVLRSPMGLKKVRGLAFKGVSLLFMLATVWSVIKLIFTLMRVIIMGTLSVVGHIFGSLYTAIRGESYDHATA